MQKHSNPLPPIALLAAVVVVATAGCKAPPPAHAQAATGATNLEPVTAPSATPLPLPTDRMQAEMTFAPKVPPPIHRHHPAILEASLDAKRVTRKVGDGDLEYTFWTFDGHTPGPFIRARVGDVLELTLSNSDTTGMPHDVDLHAVTGPGGGSVATLVARGQKKTVRFRLLYPGLFVYHCAVPPVADHIANGMYGLILVEPKAGLPTVDHEFYVMQSEIYAGDPKPGTKVLPYDAKAGLAERPRYVVFDGAVGALMYDNALHAKTGDRVRIYFGDIGPNLISSFHVIGEHFDHVYREGDLESPPAHDVQTTLVPAGGATVVDFGLTVPGTYTLVDHAIFRIEQGAIGQLVVTGAPRPDVFANALQVKAGNE